MVNSSSKTRTNTTQFAHRFHFLFEERTIIYHDNVGFQQPARPRSPAGSSDPLAGRTRVPRATT